MDFAFSKDEREATGKRIKNRRWVIVEQINKIIINLRKPEVINGL